MAKEFETKILDVDVDKVEKKLKKIGAKGEPEFLYKRWVFDIDSSKEEWIRLRDDGKGVTITYKCKKGSRISETEELEVEVFDFKTMAKILSKLDFANSYYQENKRKLYRLGDVEFAIDTWPKIPTYLEIESLSERKVKKGLELLDLEGKDIGNLSVKDVYLKYGLDLHSFEKLKFD